MSRILATLASVSMLLIIGAFGFGLAIGDIYEPEPKLDTSSRATYHLLVGLAAALVVVLVESVIVTYFIGTSRWCKEVVETYRFDPAIVARSNRLKRRTFPWALAGMLAIVGVIALGAASDPATGRANTAAWADWHLAAALAGTVLIGWTYVAAWLNVTAQHAIIEELVGQVAEVRRAQGLDEAVIAGQLGPEPSQ